MVWLHWAGSAVVIHWPAHSNPRVGLCPLGRDPGFTASRVEGAASGWFDRATKTSRSRQWKDNGPVPLEPTMGAWDGLQVRSGRRISSPWGQKGEIVV
ncbi:hypothetical protein CDL15_Pgr026240 [Punica granatum]|uniref:Uncharacterized protein n=1 Tax=Punica granatum TaxID=22663 RepID=A0A218VTT7_PUNGR|nr:hypothetical protein CDL15_Pgr026240 [Punica granatum]